LSHGAPTLVLSAAPAAKFLRRLPDLPPQRPRAILAAGRIEDLLAYRTREPDAVTNPPAQEHFLPLIVALGAGGQTPARRLHRGATYGALHRDAYAIGEEPA